MGGVARSATRWVAAGRVGSRPRVQREQRERQRQQETRNPGQPTPATHPGKKYAVREPLTPTNITFEALLKLPF